MVTITVYSVSYFIWRFLCALYVSLADWIGHLLGFAHPHEVEADCRGDAWFATEYIYSNHWRPGRGHVESITKGPGPRWTTWVLDHWIVPTATVGGIVLAIGSLVKA